MPEVVLNHTLSLELIPKVARRLWKVQLDAASEGRIVASRARIDEAVARQEVVYGINTGFGKLATVRIEPQDIVRLQENLILSHAVGYGEPLKEDEVRTMILLRAATFCRGNSGVRLELVRFLLDMLNRRVYPKIPSRGSVGASGDLSPLAHLCLVMLGEGNGYIDGREVSGRDALGRVGLSQFEFAAKEGLAMINGTQAMTAVGVLALMDLSEALVAADIIAAMSLDALLGSVAAMDELIHQARPHPGQLQTADNMRRLLAESQIVASHQDCDRVQDAYSLRCVPQVHGAVRDMVRYVRGVLEIEIGSATDNPLVFAEADKIISGGNFHGAPVALALDALAIAAAQLGSISERRTYRLLDPTMSGLPPFLTREGGLHSGLMMTQYTAASLVSENKVLAHPASVDSIPTGGGQEDHVSMGMTAALKLRRVVDHVLQILAIELLCAAQALDFRAPLKAGVGARAAYDEFRMLSRAIERDRFMEKDMESALDLIRTGDLRDRVESVVGPLHAT